MKRLLLSLVATLLLAATAFAAEEARFALVIGNSAYEGDMALANPANDASDVADALSSIGWKVTKLLDGDRKSMNKVIGQFRDAMSGSRNATGMLFYAGHGIQIGGTNYLIPIKETFETPDDVINDAISLQTIMNAFDDAKVATNIVILDACRDNPFIKKNTRSLGGTRGLSVVSKPSSVEGSAVLFATAPGDTAADGSGRNGVFTQALLKYITTDLSLQVLATKVTGDVKRATGGKQTPYSSLSLSDEFFMVPASLRTNAPVTTAEVPVMPAPVVTKAAPAADNATVVLASLIIEKQSLTTKRQKLVDGSSLGGLLGAIGWGTAVVGAGLAGYAWFSADAAHKDYAAATSGFDAKWAQVELLNLLFQIGQGAAGGGLALGVTSFFLGPDTSQVDAQLKDVERKMVLVGGN